MQALLLIIPDLTLSYSTRVMSTQSGITASEKLLDAFKSLEGAVLVVTLSEDSTQLVEDDTFTQPKDTDPKSVFSSLYKHFETQYPKPGYAIVPRSQPGEHAFISFIPDVAPIRQKMLFASTKNTLIQQLGSGSFGKSYILAFSELDELTHGHFEHATLTKQDPSLLTSEEASLKEINSLQSLTLSQTAGSAFKKELPSMHGLGGGPLSFKVDEKLDQVLREPIDDAVIVMNISASEEVELTSKKTDVKVADLIHTVQNAVSGRPASPLYVLFGYAAGKVAFIYLCPSGSKVRERMVYAANKQGLLSHLKADYFTGGQIDQILEVGDLDEIEISKLVAQPTATAFTEKSGLKFSKPKGPRRR